MSEGPSKTPVELLSEEVNSVFNLEELSIPLSGKEQSVVKTFSNLEKMKNDGLISEEDAERMFIKAAESLIEIIKERQEKVNDVADSQILSRIDTSNETKDLSSVEGFRDTRPEPSADVGREALNKIALFAKNVIDNYTKKDFAGEDSTENLSNSIGESIREKLEAAEKVSGYTVDENSNQVEDRRSAILAELDEAKDNLAPDELRNIEAEIAESFYKIYRNHLLSKLEEYENKDIPFGGIQWETRLEERVQGSMKLIVEKQLGFRLADIKQEQKNLGSEDSPAEVFEAVLSLVDQSLPEELKTLAVDFAEDYLTLEEEYTSRKFLNLTWTSFNKEILGESGARNYPEVGAERSAPLIHKVDYLIKSGLRKERFGKITNPVIEENRLANIESDSEYDEREDLTYEATASGETMRALDRWARGKLKLGAVTTARVHTSEAALVSNLTDYLNRRHREKYGADAPAIYTENQVLRSWRTWACTTFHYSARAATSTEGPDNIYYMHKMFHYNESNAEAGTDPWYPLVTEMLFTRRDKDGNKINPLEYIWVEKDNTELREEISKKLGGKSAPIMDRVLPEGMRPGLSKMKKALKESGYLDESKERFNREGFHSYGFLTNSLLSMTDYALTEGWMEIEVGDDKKLVRKRVSELKKHKETGEYELKSPGETFTKHDEWEDVPDEREDFTVQPILASLFLKHNKGPNKGKAKRFPTDPEGNLGRPMTFLDHQDEWGEIIYEDLPLSESSTDWFSALTGLHNNATVFLNKFLKSKDILETLGSPKEVAGFKKDGKYVMNHLPSYGALIASKLDKETPETEKLYQALMSMIIAQLVFTALLIKTDIADEDHWSLQQVREYLNKLIANTNAVSNETADAIYEGIKGGSGAELHVSSGLRNLLKRIRERQKYSVSGK